MVTIVQTREELWKQIWSWPVVAVVVPLLITGGFAFMTSNHPWFADVFYLAGGILLIIKFLTWEVAREQDRPKRIKSYVLVIGLTLAALCAAIWGDHRLSAPGVVQSPPVQHPPENKIEDTPKAGASETQIPQSPPERVLDKQVKTVKPPQGKTSVKGHGNVAGNSVSGNGNVVGNNNQVTSPSLKVNNAPGGIVIDGGNVINPTVNNYGLLPPRVSWSIDDKPPLENAKHPQVCVKISIDRTFLDAKFAVVCDRACKAVKGNIVLRHAGIAQADWGTIPNHPEIAAFVVNQPNPMPSEVEFLAYVESADDKPVRVLDVKRLAIERSNQ